MHVFVGFIHRLYSLCYALDVFFCMWLSTTLCMFECSCVVHPKHNMWPWLKVDYFNCSKIRKCLHLPTLPLLVTSAENKWSLMAFFKFLVHGAAVSVFHGSEWCGPCSLEFLAARSEALIYQDVLAVRCVHGKGNSDNSARTPAHTTLSESLFTLGQRLCHWFRKWNRVSGTVNRRSTEIKTYKWEWEL